MKKFKLKKDMLVTTLKVYSKSIVIEGIGLTLILSLFALLLFTNIFRVISNGKYNYETYLYEKEVLTQIQGKNESLKEDIAYVQSDEYKRLLARDTLNMVEPTETIFETKETPVYYDEEKEYLDINSKDKFEGWWKNLLASCVN
jgi:cell division protein FtsB